MTKTKEGKTEFLGYFCLSIWIIFGTIGLLGWGDGGGGGGSAGAVETTGDVTATGADTAIGVFKDNNVKGLRYVSDNQNGVIAGYMLDANGQPLAIESLGIRYLHGEMDTDEVQRLFPERYATDSVNPDEFWGEQFALGDLPPGTYEVAFTYRRAYKLQVEVLPGQLTLVAFCLEK